MNIKIIIARSVLLLGFAADATADHYYSHKAPVYGNPYGNDSNSYQLRSPSGRYMGNLNDNRYDSNSISNPYGRYGNPYSPESINNPYRVEPSLSLPLLAAGGRVINTYKVRSSQRANRELPDRF